MWIDAVVALDGSVDPNDEVVLEAAPDPRIPRAAFTAGDLQALNDAVVRVCPDPWHALDGLDADVRSVFVLDEAVTAAYGDGFTAIYDRWSFSDDFPERLALAAERVDRPRYADLFRRIHATIPGAIRNDRRERLRWVDEHGDTYDDEFAALDAVDPLPEVLRAYVHAHCASFFAG
jgi:hypothetical protein